MDLTGPNAMTRMDEELYRTSSQLKKFVNNEKYKTSLKNTTMYLKKLERSGIKRTRRIFMDNTISIQKQYQSPKAPLFTTPFLETTKGWKMAQLKKYFKKSLKTIL